MLMVRDPVSALCSRITSSARVTANPIPAFINQAVNAGCIFIATRKRNAFLGKRAGTHRHVTQTPFIDVVDEDEVVSRDDMVRVGVGDCQVAHLPLVTASLDRHHRELATTRPAAGCPE
jgi:hypothetical protein